MVTIQNPMSTLMCLLSIVLTMAHMLTVHYCRLHLAARSGSLLTVFFQLFYHALSRRYPNLFFLGFKPELSTWTPKVCKATAQSLSKEPTRPLFYILSGCRHGCCFTQNSIPCSGLLQQDLGRRIHAEGSARAKPQH